MKINYRVSVPIFVSILFLLASCKKEDAGSRSFDSSNPVGYVVYGTYKHDFMHPGVNQPLVIKFLPDNRIEYNNYLGTATYPYTMSNDTFYINGTDYESFVIKDEKVTRYVYAADIRGFSLNVRKVPSGNELEGKTFSGKYYKPDGSVLHNNFIYGFIPGNKLTAAFTPGAIERTNDYTSIANIASRSHPAAGQVEFTLLIDGKLYATYANGQALQYGTFEWN
ncbi:MAG: hypothetical protein EOO05_18795 [Chitinophagaceae bacterium]|nr:MAG: hypothetical protein EOO05_18795 [Chitinophagaceae bacterium]